MRSAMDKLSRLIGHLTVRQQIGAAAAALCVLIVAVIAGATGYLSARQADAFVRQDLAGTARVMSDQLDRTLSTRYREVRILASLEPLQPLWHTDAAQLRAVLEQLQLSYPDYSWIGFADLNGNVRAATGGMLEGASVKARPWFKNALLGPTVEDVHEAELLEKLLGPRRSGEPFRFVDVAFPVRDAVGRITGVLGAHLSWDFASALRQATLRTTDPESGTQLLVLANDGKVLLGGTMLSTPFSPAEIARMKARHSGTFVDDNGPTRMLAAYATSDARLDYPGLGWIVVARQPYATALAPVHALVRNITVIGIAAAALGVLLALVIAGRIARPIHALTVEADRLGREPGSSMLSRHAGSSEVLQLSTALRSLLRRIGFAEQRTHEAELRATEGAQQYAHDVQMLRRMAETDPLTNLMNRRAFLAAANDAFDYYRRYDRPIAMLMVDIDHFKQVNDTYGHAAGDAVIKRIGELIEDALRTTDKIGRFGGEEFLVLLREVDETSARTLASRIQERIAVTPVGYGSKEVPVSVSIGVALVAPCDRDVSDTIERADRGLYVAKNTGRNRVFFYPLAGEAAALAAA
jgi:diguanylate cyclase (GGDEF)-like protein